MPLRRHRESSIEAALVLQHRQEALKLLPAHAAPLPSRPGGETAHSHRFEPIKPRDTFRVEFRNFSREVG